MVRRVSDMHRRGAALRSGLARGGFGLLVLAMAQTAAAQAPNNPISTTSASYGNWQLRCESRKVEARTVKACEVSTNVMVKADNGTSGTAAIVAFGRHPDKEGWQVALQLPIIVWLPTGAKLGIGDEAPLVEASFVACRPTLCSAGATVADAVIARLRAATSDLTVAYRAQTQQAVKVTLSVKGLPEALAALGKEMAS